MPSPTRSPAQSADQAIAHAAPRTALATLGDLAVRGRAPKSGYDRGLFGQAWADTDRNGCDTRNDMLARDLTGETFKAGTGGCVVLAGTLQDPFTGATIAFTRGQTTSMAVQIDHVVALSDAWQKGAQKWVARKRLAFANDPLNLLAVDGPANAQKGDGDAATWLPPNKRIRCAYVARQIAVKGKYHLSVTSAERTAMARILSACPGQRLPSSSAPTIAPIKPSTGNAGSSGGSRGGSGSATYVNCSAVRAAGKAPLHRGEPGYSRSLDRDGDGVACETSSGGGSSSGSESSGGSSSGGSAYYANCDAARAAGAAPVRRGDPGYGRHLDRDGDGVACE